MSPRRARSFRAASPAPSRSISASSRWRSSGRAFWRCCPTPISTEGHLDGSHSPAEGRQSRQHRRTREGALRLRPQFSAAAGQGDPGDSREHCALRGPPRRSEEHTSELQSQSNLVCRLLLEKKKKKIKKINNKKRKNNKK